MTLEEIHEQLEDIQRGITDERFMFTDDEIEFNGELIKIVEELKIYKKSLELACKELDEHSTNPNCNVMPISYRGVSDIEEYFLTKAEESLRKEE